MKKSRIMKKKYKPGTIAFVKSGADLLAFVASGLMVLDGIGKIMEAGRNARQSQVDPITEDAEFEIVAPKQLTN